MMPWEALRKVPKKAKKAFGMVNYDLIIDSYLMQI